MKCYKQRCTNLWQFPIRNEAVEREEAVGPHLANETGSRCDSDDVGVSEPRHQGVRCTPGTEAVIRPCAGGLGIAAKGVNDGRENV